VVDLPILGTNRVAPVTRDQMRRTTKEMSEIRDAVFGRAYANAFGARPRMAYGHGFPTRPASLEYAVDPRMIRFGNRRW